MNDIRPFRFWVQNALPLVYDDSLSYYELLCKVVDYINKLIGNDKELVAIYEQLEKIVNDFIDSADIPAIVEEKLDEMIAAAQSSRSQIRNIAVDASSSTLKDDRGTDADQLYKDAARLAQDLKNGHKDAIEEDAREETVEMQHQNKPDNSSQKAYSGPSVVSYTLDGRKASHLKIPAYRCYGAGDVTVIITVNPQGQVINAQVMDAISANDQCLRNFAVRAARLSRFSASNTAPAKQTGEILYRFIAQ